VIEPTFTVRRITAIDNFDQIVKIDGTDNIVGGTTNLTYGLNNRLYAKKTTAKEIVSVGITQSYYTDARASQFDPSYLSNYGSQAKPSNFSPVQLQTRVSPTDRFQTNFATEYNIDANTFTTFTASGSLNLSRFQFTGGWSERRYLAKVPGFDNPALANHDINAMVTFRRPDNHVGGIYQFNYDLRNDFFRQQRIMAYYNAQCCGINIEYQTYNLGGYSSFVVPQDHRFNLSFTLAGIGTFSNFFGAFGGQQGR
jgi:hypothetical protein